MKLQAFSHNYHNPPMDKRLINLFPIDIRKGITEIFGQQPLQTVLLQLLPANTVNEHFFSFLHPKEATILGSYRFSKRRSEYLTGRICAKLAIRDFSYRNKIHSYPLNLQEIEIGKTANGRPTALVHTQNADELKIDISISHSGDYVVALAAQLNCGIDLQQQKPALLRVQEKYCSKAESKILEMFLADNDAVTRLTLLWAAKEAAKKALSLWQMPGFLDLELWKTKKIAGCNVFYLLLNIKNPLIPQEVIVMTGMFYGYALAICLVDEDFIHAGTTRS